MFLRPVILVDERGCAVGDPGDGSRLGFAADFPPGVLGGRIVAAASLGSSSASLVSRYQPSHPPGETCSFGMDYSALVPSGVGLVSGALSVWTNVASPVAADADWVVGEVVVRGRSLHAVLSGGVDGKDYQLRWSAVDSEGNVWPRTALCLVARVS